MKTTTNYELKKPEVTDKIVASIEALNENADTLDEKIEILQTLLDTVRQQIFELINGSDEEPTEPISAVQDFTYDQDSGVAMVKKTNGDPYPVYIGMSNAEIIASISESFDVARHTANAAGGIATLIFEAFSHIFMQSNVPGHFNLGDYTRFDHGSDFNGMVQEFRILWDQLVDFPRLTGDFADSFRQLLGIGNTIKPEIFKDALLNIMNDPGWIGSRQVLEEDIIKPILENYRPLHELQQRYDDLQMRLDEMENSFDARVEQILMERGLL